MFPYHITPCRTRVAARSFFAGWRAWACGIVVAGLLGCGAQPSANNAEMSAARPPKKSASQKKSSKGHQPIVTEKDGKKYLDGIPYDVWLDDPLAVVANTAAVAPSGSGTSPAQTASTTTDAPSSKPEEKPAAAAATNDWAAYIATDQLQEESKRIRNQLKTLLQTQATYNSDFEVIKMDGAVMAALAGIALESADGVSWKGNASYIRDYGLELVEAAKGLGKPNYDKTNAAYENMQAVFDGSIPAGVAQPEAKRPFADVASRFYLMKRMKLAFDALKLNVNTEAKLKSDQDQALHEAMILSALSKIITLEGYSSADETEYQGFAKEMIDQCLNAVQSIKDQDFSKFQDAVNKIDKTCGECHVQYRNG
jgi:hypothetical protein